MGAWSPGSRCTRARAYRRGVLPFLRRPKWIVFGIVVAILAVSFVSLGFWQLRRLEGVRTENERILASRSTQISPAGQVLDTERPPPAELEYQRVTATGRYDTEHEVIVRGRQVTDQNGAFVLTPLITESGTALLVVRGWVPPGPRADAEPEVPPATPGTVTVVGRVRLPETGAGPSRATEVGRFLSVTRIVPDELEPRIGVPTYDAYVELLEQTPPPPAEPAPAPIPQGTLSEGNHESYAYQWFTFAVMAVGGYVLLIVLEQRRRRSEATGPDDTEPSEQPAGV
jgi:cytochrome oxidase assembly protein ShyY1